MSSTWPKGTAFCSDPSFVNSAAHRVYHSWDDWALIQKSVTVEPAKPKTEFVKLPGGDGAIDRTDAMGGTRYNQRKITWIFRMKESTNWFNKQSTVSDRINGQLMWIRLDEQPGWLYRGRISVTKHSRSKELKEITVEAICDPWKYEDEISEESRSISPTSMPCVFPMNNGRCVPDVAIDQDTTIVFPSMYAGNNITATFSAPNPGTLTALDRETILKSGLEMFDSQNSNIFQINAKTVSANSGTIKLTYRRLSL